MYTAQLHKLTALFIGGLSFLLTFNCAVISNLVNVNILDSDRTGNQTIFGRTGYNPSKVEDDEDTFNTQEVQKSYNGSQLWRIYNLSYVDDLHGMASTLEEHFGGNIWKDHADFLDVSFQEQQLRNVSRYLQNLNLHSKVLIPNIQDLMDQEQLPSTQSNKRTRRATSLRRMNWDNYHDIDVIYEFLKEMRLAYPDLCRLYTIGNTAEGRELKVMRISENPADYGKIWIDGGIHAREWISPAVVTYVLYNLLTNWSTLPRYLTSKTWYIMPVMNPDGYMYSRKTNRLWRKNRSKNSRYRCYGVDLNRNFNINWKGQGSSAQPCSDTYRGISPESELETQAVVKFLSRRKHNLGAYLTYHSYGQLLVYPWAYKTARVDDHKDLQAVAQASVNNIKQQTGQSYQAGPTYEMLGVAGGGSDDWCRALLGTKYVYTIELRDQGYYGFVLPKSQIKGTAKEGYTIVDTVAKYF